MSRSIALGPSLLTACYWLLLVLSTSHAFVITTRHTSCRQSPSFKPRSLFSTASSISQNADLIPGIETINEHNHELYEMLKALRYEPFFRLYSVDMLASCEYIPQELTECYSETCEIYPIEEEDVPDEIRVVDEREFEFDMDGWGRWDMPSEDYYDTEQFPEDYTGYDGSDVWKFIHNRICFEGYEYDDDHWKADFNKAVSGVHSMISAQIIRGISKRITTGEGFTEEEQWTDPNVEFNRRLAGDTVPLAIENLYFCYMLCLTAATKARDRLLQDCESGKIDAATAQLLKPLFDMSPLLNEDNKEKIEVAFRKLHDHGENDASSLWEARMRSRELLRVMNCVQCNKCRLHGKIGMMGFSTALQILVGRTGDGGDVTRVHRVELAALMTTLFKFSRAIETSQKYLNQ